MVYLWSDEEFSIKLEDIGISKNASIFSIANLNPTYSFESESLSDTVKSITASGHRRIPIISKNNTLVGILTYMDVLNALLRGLSSNTQISSFMTREVIYSEISETISHVLQIMKISKKGGLPLIKNSKLVGMIGERDFIRSLSDQYFGIPISSVMSHKPLYISPQTSIRNCMKTMINTQYRRLPVVDGREVVGIVTGLDVLKYIKDTNYNQTDLNENVEEIMSTPVAYVTEYDDVSDAIRFVIDRGIGGLVVLDTENSLKGIITERDIIELL